MSNTNLLNPNEFIFTLNRLSDVKYYVQAANVPGLNMGRTSLPTPFKNSNLPGDKIEYDLLTLEILVDKDMSSWLATYNWMMGLGSPRGFDGYKTISESDDGLMSDGTLIILGNNKNPSVQFSFRNLFPVSISGVNLDTRSSDIEYPTYTVDFSHSGFTVT